MRLLSAPIYNEQGKRLWAGISLGVTDRHPHFRPPSAVRGSQTEALLGPLRNLSAREEGLLRDARGTSPDSLRPLGTRAVTPSE